MALPAKGAIEHIKHGVLLLAQRVQAGADDAEMRGALEGAETAGDLLLDLGGAHGTFDLVVGERRGEVGNEAQHRLWCRRSRLSKLVAGDCLARRPVVEGWTGWCRSPSVTMSS